MERKKVNDKFHLSNLRGLLFKVVLSVQSCYLVHDHKPILSTLPLLNGRHNVSLDWTLGLSIRIKSTKPIFYALEKSPTNKMSIFKLKFKKGKRNAI